MFRYKIRLIATLCVLVMIFLAYIMTIMPMSKAARKSVDDAVNRAATLAPNSVRLKGFDLVELAEEIASRKEFVDSVQVAVEKDRRTYVFDAIDQFDKKLAEENRKAHFFGVFNTEGAIIARDLDPNNLYGEKLPYLNIQQALKGKSATDIWYMKNRLMRAAAAPIKVGAEIKGVVAVAYDITSADAREQRDLMGAHVAYFIENVVRASSFSLKGDDNSEDSARVEALNHKLASLPAKSAVKEEKTSEPFEIQLGNETFLAVVGALPIKLTQKNVGFIVLSSLDQAQEQVVSLRWMFLVLCLGMLLIVIGGMWFVSKHFVDAEDKLELGVNELINGNMEYSFEATEEFEGLANGLNVLLARLLGRPEPGDEDGEENAASWGADVIVVEELSAEPASADIVRKLTAESEDAYYQRLFQEYADARKRWGLSLEGLSKDGVTQKLKANEAMLKAKHKCERIRFIINAQGGKVGFKPVRLD